MPRTAIKHNQTGALLVLDPPTREDGSVIMPEGVDASVVTLTPAEEAALQDAADVAVAALQAEAAASTQLKQQIVSLAQSAVGMLLSDLTTAQRSALTACLLWKAGGVTGDMKVKPLAGWLHQD